MSFCGFQRSGFQHPGFQVCVPVHGGGDKKKRKRKPDYIAHARIEDGEIMDITKMFLDIKDRK